MPLFMFIFHKNRTILCTLIDWLKIHAVLESEMYMYLGCNQKDEFMSEKKAWYIYTFYSSMFSSIFDQDEVSFLILSSDTAGSFSF